MKIDKINSTMFFGLVLFMAMIVPVGMRDNGVAAAQSVNKPDAPQQVKKVMPLSGYQLYQGHRIFLGTVPPVRLPFIYSFTITDTTGTWTTTVTVSCFQTRFVSNVSPTGTVAGTPGFSWTGIKDPRARYGVELDDGGGKRIWNDYAISGSSIMYSGPALIPGMTYSYLVLVECSSTCCNQGSSFVSGSFIYR